jgi:tape measure domain-containing protein
VNLGAISFGVTSIVGALGALVGATLGFATISTAQIEQVKVQFEALLGSTQEADKFLQQLFDLAARTPFEVKGLAENAANLLAISDAAGLARDEILPTLTTIGDLTSVLGQPIESVDRVVRAIGQIASKGRVMSEELNQITEALPGFPAFKELADGLGLTGEQLRKQLRDGAIPAAEGIDILLQAMSRFPGAAGAMIKQSKTLTGLFSTLKDVIRFELIDAFEPFTDTLRNTLANAFPLIQTAIRQIAGPINELGITILNGLIRVIELAGPVLGDLFEAINRIADLVGDRANDALEGLFETVDELIPLFVDLVDAALPIVDFFRALVQTFLPPVLRFLDRLIQALDPVVEAFSDFATEAVVGLGPTLDIISDALGDLADVLSDVFVDVIEQIQPTLPELTESFADLAAALADLLIAITPVVPPLAELLAILIEVAALTSANTITATAKAIEGLSFVLTPIIDLFSRFLQLLNDVVFSSDAFHTFATTLLSLSSPVFLLIGAFTFLRDFITGPLQDAVLAVIDFFQGPFVDALQTAGDAIVDGFGAAIEGVGDAFDAVFDSVLSPFIDWIKNTFSPEIAAASFVLGVFVVGFSALADTASNVFHSVLEPLGQFLGGAFTTAVSTASDFVRSLDEVFDNLVDAVQGAVDGFIGGFQRFLAFIAPFTNAVRGALETAGGAVLGFLGGVVNVVGQVLSFFRDNVVQPIVDLLRGPFTDAVNFAKDNLGGFFVLLALGSPILAAFDLVLRGIKPVIDGISDAIGFLKDNALQPIIDTLGGPASFVFGIFKDLLGGIRDAFDDISDSVGDAASALSQAVGDTFEPIFGTMHDVWNVTLDTFTDLWGALKDILGDIADILFDVKDAFAPLFDTITENNGILDTLKDLLGTIRDALKDIGGSIRDTFVPLWEDFVDLWNEALKPVLSDLKDILEDIVEDLKPFLPLLRPLFELLFKLAFVVLALGLIPILVQLIAVLGIVRFVLELVKEGVEKLSFVFQLFFQTVLKPAIDFIQLVAMFALVLFKQVIDFVRDAINQLSFALQVFYLTILKPFIDFVLTIAQFALIIFKQAIDQVRGAVEKVSFAIQILLEGVIKPFAQFLIDRLRQALDFARGGLQLLRDAANRVADIFGRVLDLGTRIADFLRTAFRNAINVATGILSPFAGALSAVASVISTIADVARAAADAVGGLIDTLSNLPGAGVLGNIAGFLGGVFAEGGIVKKPMLAVVGEAGPEVILPLRDRQRSLDLLAQSGLLGSSDGGARFGTSVTTTGTSSGVTIGAVNLTVTFAGVVPTDQQARRAGQQAWLGVEETIRKRRVRTEARLA